MITPERLDQVTVVVERAGLNDQTMSALRATFRDMHLTYCMDEDIGIEEPVRRAQGFNIYLVDGQGHCMRFTTNPQAATGLVLAELEDEDG
jgi:hypothetical protein